MTLIIVLSSGNRVTFEQLTTLAEIRKLHPEMKAHINDCRCCWVVHTDVGDYLVGSNGEYDFYPLDLDD